MWLRIEKQLNDQLPFVVYCKPRQKEINAIFQKDKHLNLVSDFTESGFVFAPFESKLDVVLIPFDEVERFEFSEQYSTADDLDIEQFSEFSRDGYLEQLRKSISEIESGSFSKVVLSRSINVKNTSSAILLFKRIVSLYNSAFCYLWFHPKVGMWLGATPEILLQTVEDKFTTMSLAGTMPYQSTGDLKWGQKELEEQSLVTEFILNALEGKINNLQAGEIETTKAGELVHLRTKITGSIKSNILNEIINALHPTPAVCGFPKKAAMKFISSTEGYDRQYYAGFLGELNLNEGKSTTLYVNLRCMQKIADTFRLYVGGGVTKDSVPDKEWEETVNKSRTMLRVLYN